MRLSARRRIFVPRYSSSRVRASEERALPSFSGTSRLSSLSRSYLRRRRRLPPKRGGSSSTPPPARRLAPASSGGPRRAEPWARLRRPPASSPAPAGPSQTHLPSAFTLRAARVADRRFAFTQPRFPREGTSTSVGARHRRAISLDARAGFNPLSNTPNTDGFHTAPLGVARTLRTTARYELLSVVHRKVRHTFTPADQPEHHRPSQSSASPRSPTHMAPARAADLPEHLFLISRLALSTSSRPRPLPELALLHEEETMTSVRFNASPPSWGHQNC